MQLTAQQLAAVRQVAKYYGRTWKQSLREAWMTGQYGSYMDAPVLQQIRNSFGPSWLVRFRLADVHDEVPTFSETEITALRRMKKSDSV
jgi:hypothetical protein